MAQMLAHALEFPGKRRLDRDTYLKVQAIYYPGFTIGGAFEPLSMIATFALLLFTPFGTTSFWLTALAFAGLGAGTCDLLGGHAPGEQGLGEGREPQQVRRRLLRRRQHDRHRRLDRAARPLGMVPCRARGARPWPAWSPSSWRR